MFDIQPFCVGTLQAPRWEVLFGENSTALEPLDFYVWLVTDGQRHGLIDSGLPLEPSDLQALDHANMSVHPEAAFANPRTLRDALDHFGLQPEEIDFVLITQTVTYCTGGLDEALLPNAQIYLAKPGLMEFLEGGPDHPPQEFYFTSRGWAALGEFATQRRLHLISESVEVANGITFDVTGGHHPGSAGVRISTPHGGVGILETAFTIDNLSTGRPIGIAENAAEARRAMEWYTRTCDVVVPIHQPGLTDGLSTWLERVRSESSKQRAEQPTQPASTTKESAS